MFGETSAVPEAWRALGRLDDPLTRRRCREALNDESTLQLLGRAGLKAGWVCAEIGAGTGSVAADMAKIVGESGAVLATEIRTELVAQLRAELPSSVEVLQHDCTQPLPENSYDLIHARFVLEHLENRTHVLENLRRALRPGGYLLIEDALFLSPDFGGYPVLREATDLFTSRLALTGTDYQWARSLPASGSGAIYTSVDYPVFAGGSQWAWFWASTLASVLHDDEVVRRSQVILSDRTKWFEGPAVIRCIFQEGE